MAMGTWDLSKGIEGWRGVYHDFVEPRAEMAVVSCNECGVIGTHDKMLDMNWPYEVAKRHLKETAGHGHTVTMHTSRVSAIKERLQPRTTVDGGRHE